VAKADIGPVIDAVAIGALPDVVFLLKRDMARLAIDKATVVEIDIAPVFRIVTIGALAPIVVHR
jgi:hypothetical protein